MFQAFIIVLREGFEAFLIVAITLAYLRRTGRSSLVVSVHAGVVAAVVASAALGWMLMQGANLPLWEGALGLLALPLVFGLVAHMWRAGPRLRGQMEERIEASASRPASRSAATGVFLFLDRDGRCARALAGGDVAARWKAVARSVFHRLILRPDTGPGGAAAGGERRCG